MMKLKHMNSITRCASVCEAYRQPTRRTLLTAGIATIVSAQPAIVFGNPGRLGAAQKMTFDDLVLRARKGAARAFVPAPTPASDVMERINYAAHWKIQFRDSETLYPAGDALPIQLFHVGRYFPSPVRIHLRGGDGTAQEVKFRRDLFEMPPDSPARALPEDIGFAGFRVMRPGLEPDWVSFLGASYFRTDGPDAQYGLSARGIAVNTGMNVPEEFPRFTAFWIGPPEHDGDDISVWAALDGPSVTGAYRFGLVRNADGKGSVTRVSARIFLRQDVERLGIAPLTSMYWYSERDQIIGKDWRPEIHDSDGLALETGGGERLWRPLSNPASVTTSSFFDENPRGFGLIQRDRTFDNYQDDGVFYHRRPSAWITPSGDWGRGAVQLVEIPTEDETFDNIVAYWVPEAPTRAGDAFRFDYDIEWRARDPHPESVSRVVATRQGQGGVAGDPVPEGVGKMVIDFDGTAFSGLDRESGVEPVIEARNGTIRAPVDTYPVVGTKLWRLMFDFSQTGKGPVSLRAYLRHNGEALTETWVANAWAEREG